jgi:hypothetical protein
LIEVHDEKRQFVMEKTGKKVIGNFTVMILVFGAAQLLPVYHLYAQGQRAALDTALTSKYRYGMKDGFNVPTLAYSGKGSTDPYGSSLKSLGQYRLTLAKNFSIQAAGRSSYLASPNTNYLLSESSPAGMNNPNSNNFRRGDLGLRGIRLDIQHFTLGASTNYGLNSLGRSGGLELPQNSRNAGLSLHAGLSF